ncbi:hypothetical protein BCIN_13g01770 [Botrytis cinerea B05.10]|uniref:Fucose-specific lectin n=1 Tax=Botryotinia fuckeliana (strain B05.10) TaxID=332648 RepID=A0A384K0H3_BOTFB|nr:hypothetical protein BCIN_13g01770 [Botrytis cinerea B05.10]ATZ56336.1 hypothetical protein BCIN_13g01770 [Botrytis cinerea B05.10]
MHLSAFMTWLWVAEAAYTPTISSLSGDKLRSTVFLTSGDGQIFGIDANLVNNAYSVGSPNIASGKFGTSVTSALSGSSNSIHVFTVDQYGCVFRAPYDGGWNDPWQSAHDGGLSQLSASQWKYDGMTIYSATTSSGGVCSTVTNTPEWKPQSCSPIPVPIPFNSTLSHVATAQPTNNGFSYVVHYVGLSIKGELLYSQQYTDNNGLDFFTQDNLSGSLTFVGEPLITRKSNTELDIWAISNTAKLYRSSYIASTNKWTAWVSLGAYPTLSKPSVTYDSSKNAYIMALSPPSSSSSTSTYLYKTHSPLTGYSPSQTTWTTSGSNWISAPAISSFNDGVSRGTDIHVWGIKNDGKLYYSYWRGNQWWPRSGAYYSVMDVPGIVPSGYEGEGDHQNELR